MSAPLDAKVITFYSYKGGTGRSMALANVAWVLASNGKRVLVIDWDLEAPGLHRYFHPFLEDKALTSTEGLIDFVTDFATEAMSPPEDEDAELPADWYKAHSDLLQYAVSLDWDFPEPGTLDFVPAGRQGPRYAQRVNSFNWRSFYDRLGGHAFLEAAKEQVRSKYDYILIDSRTGVSDTAGICTVQFPDAVVVCFTLNTQSIEGAFAAAESMDEQRRKEDGTPGVHIFPVPMRVETGEKERLGAARRASREKFSRFLWHLSAEEREAYWSQIEVFYEEYYAYEEILATFADKPRDARNSLLGSVEQLTAYITQQKVKALQPAPEAARREVLSQYLRKEPEPLPAPSKGPADYWFYLSCSAADYREQVEEFFRDISKELRGLLGTSVEVGLLDAGDASPTERRREMAVAWGVSRAFVPLFSPSYFNSAEEGSKFQYFLERLKASWPAPPTGPSPLLPVRWLPVERVPESAAPFTEVQRDFSELYRQHGLLELMRRQDLRDAYQEFLTHFSKVLVEAARARPLKVQPSLVPPGGQPNAFEEQAREGVFLSYSSRDREAVRRVRHELEARGVTGFISPEDLPAGGTWTTTLSQTLAGASAALVFLGEAISPWQQTELSAMAWREELERSTKQPMRFIPVLLPGARTEELPGFLLLRSSIDLRKNAPEEFDRLVKALLQPAQVLPSSHPIEREPYRGLLPFREEDAPLFFGREEFIRGFLGGARTVSWVTLLGPSGSGKTSLVQAGLLPQLRQQSSDAVVLFKPGARPFHALATALLALLEEPSSSEDFLKQAAELGDRLAQSGELDPVLQMTLRSGGYTRLFLIIDQFEELFVLTDAQEKRSFIRMLEAAQRVVPLSIMVVLRADFYTQLISSDDVPIMKWAGVTILGGLGREELRQAIERPAALLGVRFEAGLVERLVEETLGEPGSLPLLQLTLSNLWKQRSGNWISHRSYEELGGTALALRNSAEQVFDKLSPQQQKLAEQLFLKLVQLQDAGPSVLRSQIWDQLDEASQRVADAFIEARLLIKSQQPDGAWTLEAAHGALFDRWPRLRLLLEAAGDTPQPRTVPRGSLARGDIGSTRGTSTPEQPIWGARHVARGFTLMGPSAVVLIAIGVLTAVIVSLRPNNLVSKPMMVREEAQAAVRALTDPESAGALRRWIRALVATGATQEAL
ncbi:MAG TPA: TIR domain-containing protein, partial [Myxococcaceae bacterium]